MRLSRNQVFAGITTPLFCTAVVASSVGREGGMGEGRAKGAVVVATAAVATSAAEMGTLRAMGRQAGRQRGGRTEEGRAAPAPSVMFSRIILLEENIFNARPRRAARARLQGNKGLRGEGNSKKEGRKSYWETEEMDKWCLLNSLSIENPCLSPNQQHYPTNQQHCNADHSRNSGSLLLQKEGVIAPSRMRRRKRN